MRKIEIKSGEQYGRLTVIEEVEKYKGRRTFLCKCDCGNYTNVILNKLRTNHTKSCGCISKELISNLNKKHNLYHLPEYRIWKGMKYRCLNSNHKRYNDYGGRGIKIHSKWIESFQEFYNYLGARPEGMSLDRIDVNGNYEPGNVRWADDITQANNKRKKV